ncbi:MAG: hypothetical protein HOP30_06725 [Cyclobacteriaceae bacterium]|nr:hypothetical protein [Cyclobacteriaceae bacterium]
MPIEIRELIIRTHVTDDDHFRKKRETPVAKWNEKEIIERCVEKVLRKLDRKKER